MSDDIVANEGVEAAEEIKESGKKGKAGSKSVGKAVKKGYKITATVDTEPSEVVEWLAEGHDVLFDEDALPKYSDEELEEFPYKVVKRYKEAREQVEKRVLSGISDIETLSGNASTKLMLRKRRGFHQTWKRPDEIEDAKRKGYIEVREAKGDEKPGYEKGPIIKIMKGQGEEELIAMEINQERYDRHIKAMTAKSRKAYMSNKEGFAGSVEQFNRNVPKDMRAKVIDDEGDVG